jgi:hypothetical protein
LTARAVVIVHRHASVLPLAVSLSVTVLALIVVIWWWAHRRR